MAGSDGSRFKLSKNGDKTKNPEKLSELIGYLERHQSEIIDYQRRQQSGKVIGVVE